MENCCFDFNEASYINQWIEILVDLHQHLWNLVTEVFILNWLTVQHLYLSSSLSLLPLWLKLIITARQLFILKDLMCLFHLQPENLQWLMNGPELQGKRDREAQGNGIWWTVLERQPGRFVPWLLTLTKELNFPSWHWVWRYLSSSPLLLLFFFFTSSWQMCCFSSFTLRLLVFLWKCDISVPLHHIHQIYLLFKVCEALRT